MFKASIQTAQLAVPDPAAPALAFHAVQGAITNAMAGTGASDAVDQLVHKARALGLRPDAHSRHLPTPGSAINLDEVRNALAEKTMRALARLAVREAATSQETTMPVLSPQGEFLPELRPALIDGTDLGPQTSSHEVLQRLAQDLNAWVTNDPEDAKLHGYSRAPDGSIQCACPSLAPVLSPLPK